MPTPVSYDVFLSNVQTADLSMMTAFIVGDTVQAADGPDADLLFAQAERLYNAGMLTRLSRNYEDQGGVVVQKFTGIVSPVGAGYVAQLARERADISRLTIPQLQAKMTLPITA